MWQKYTCTSTIFFNSIKFERETRWNEFSISKFDKILNKIFSKKYQKKKKTGIYSGYHGVAPALGYGGYGVGYAAPAIAHAAYAPALARPAVYARPAVAAAVPGTLLGNKIIINAINSIKSNLYYKLINIFIFIFIYYRCCILSCPNSRTHDL